MRYQDCPFCGEEIDTADYVYHWSYHGGQQIVECANCHRKFNVSPDAEFDDGMWRDRTTISPLLALTEWGWFWCVHCGRDFPKDWSDAEAKKEHDENFPGLPIKNSVVICDDCYNEAQAWFKARPWRGAEARRNAEIHRDTGVLP